MASSATSDISPSAALFHLLWQMQPSPFRRRNAAADGFIDESTRRRPTREWSVTAEYGSDHENYSSAHPSPFSRRTPAGPGREWSVAAECGSDNETRGSTPKASKPRRSSRRTSKPPAVAHAAKKNHRRATPESDSDEDVRDAQEVFDMLYVPPGRDFSESLPPSGSESETESEPALEAEHCFPPGSNLWRFHNDKTFWRHWDSNINDWIFGPPTLVWLLARPVIALARFLSIFIIWSRSIILPLVALYKRWTGDIYLRRHELETRYDYDHDEAFYVVEPEPGTDDASYRIPFYSEHIVSTMCEQVTFNNPAYDLCVYNIPSQYQEECDKHLWRLGLYSARTRVPEAPNDNVLVVKHGKRLRQFGPDTLEFTVAGLNKEQVERAAKQTEKYSRVLFEYRERSLSPWGSLVQAFWDNLEPWIPEAEEELTEIPRDKCLGNEAIVFNVHGSLKPKPADLPKPPTPVWKKMEDRSEHPWVEALGEYERAEFMGRNKVETGMEYEEDEYIPYEQLY